jgi:predicted TIM-barrel fold metal-dependent hydrolase
MEGQEVEMTDAERLLHGGEPDIVDCDVHPTVDRGIQTVYAYMPEAWRQRFVRKRCHQIGLQLSIKFTHPNGGIQREDARPPSGRLIASDPAFVATDLMDAHRIGAAVLNSIQSCALCTVLSSVEESIVFAAAFNDFFIDKWLSADSRYRLAIAVPSQDPCAAVAEIERVGKHPQVVAVALPMLNVLLGDRRWWPIYEAARRAELPILLHGSGTEGIFTGAPGLAGGLMDSYVERYLAMTHVAEANIANLIFSGTFEKFSGLKFVFVEFGFLWLLPLMWRMDRAWRHLRHGCPWVKRSPIDYVYEQCRFSTQPMDEPADTDDLDRLVSMIGYDPLCFSSDYPHWDNEMPAHLIGRLPASARRKVFHDNAMQTFRMNREGLA